MCVPVCVCVPLSLSVMDRLDPFPPKGPAASHFGHVKILEVDPTALDIYINYLAHGTSIRFSG